MCLSSAATSSPAEVRAAAPDAKLWFQVYVFRDRSVTESLIEEAIDSGFGALVLTVDVPFLGRRERDIRIDFKLPEQLCRTRSGSRASTRRSRGRTSSGSPATGCPSS